MLTPDQTALRIADNEIRRLKAENSALKTKIVDIKLGMIRLIEYIMSHMPKSVRSQYEDLLAQLKESL